MMKNVRMSRTTHSTKRLNPAADQIADFAGAPGEHDADTVNVGSDLAPTKKRPFNHESENTGVPEGRALPVRGEGATTNSITVKKTSF